MVVPAARIVEAHAQYALYFRACIVVGVVCLVVVLILLAEVHSAGQLAYADEVGSVNKFLAQRRHVQKTLESLHRTYVGKQAEALAHGKQTLFGAHLGRWVVVKLGVANGCEQHSVGILACLVCLFGKGVAHFVDGVCAADGLGIFKLVSKLGGHCIQDGHSLFHYLRSDTIARQNCNL